MTGGHEPWTDTIAVELRPLHVEQETETKVRARLSEELQLGRFLRHRNIGEVLGYAVDAASTLASWRSGVSVRRLP